LQRNNKPALAGAEAKRVRAHD